MTNTFGERLRAALTERGPLCVGIDPHAALLGRWGLEDSPNGLERFVRTVIEALADQVAIFKPQVAFFERFGSRGFAILEAALADLRAAGALVLLDVKRGDIGSTVEAYASAYLDPSSPLYADAITAAPYLGVGSLAPMVERARACGGGVVVLALTSNPEASTVQHARLSDGRSVAQHVVDEISQLNAGVDGLGSFGVVVGATTLGAPLDLSKLNGPVLCPGLGAQGGRPADLAALFPDPRTVVVPSYSREVLAAGPKAVDLRDAARRARDACRDALARRV